MRPSRIHRSLAGIARLFCPNYLCTSRELSPKSKRFIRKGVYWRKSDGRAIRRYQCSHCQKYFSGATHSPYFRQKKRNLNFKIWRLQSSLVSQRRCAEFLNLNRKTVARKMRLLAALARIEQEETMRKFAPLSEHIQFDELETFEHTRCKPISVQLVVDQKSRLILGISACPMPARGPLAEISRRKYGFRPDLRHRTLERTFRNLRPHLNPMITVTSDSNPMYGPVVKRVLPHSTHLKVLSRKATLHGQGELKKIVWDPIYAVNHTCAMLRANINRLIRKSWCTTKRLWALKDHLAIYVMFHNRQIMHALVTKAREKRRQRDQ